MQQNEQARFRHSGMYLLGDVTNIRYTPENILLFQHLNIPIAQTNGNIRLISDILIALSTDDINQQIQQLLELYFDNDSEKFIYINTDTSLDTIDFPTFNCKK